MFSHGGNIFYYARQLGCAPEELLDFSANINPLGPSEKGMEAIRCHMEEISSYPEPEGETLACSLASRYGLSPSQVILGNGAAELFYLLVRALHPARVLIMAPAFSEYARSARAEGACVIEVPALAGEAFAFPLADFIQAIPERGLIFLGNPNNPDGRLLDKAVGLRILQEARRRGTWVVLDESFIDFLENSRTYSYKSYMKDFGNLIIVHSLTKFYAVPGLRLGFAVAREDVTERMRAMKDVWNVNSLALAYGQAVLDDEIYRQKSVHIVAVQKKLLYNALCRFSALQVYEPAVNFMLCRLSETAMTAAQLQEQLLPYKILIRVCHNYTGLDEQFFRIAVKDGAGNERLCKALQEVFNK